MIVVSVATGGAHSVGGFCTCVGSVTTEAFGAPGAFVRKETGSVSKTAGTLFVADTRT